MTARLFSKTGALAGTDFQIDREALIGRDAQCDLVLFPHTISSRHARIFYKEAARAYFIEDLGSSNGTLVDRVPLREAVRLNALNVITFASDIHFIFQMGAKAAPAAPAPAAPVRRVPDRGASTSLGSPSSLSAGGLATFGPDDPGMRTSMGQSFAALPDLPGMDQETLPPSPAPAPPPAIEYALELKLADGKEMRVALKTGNYLLGRGSMCDIVVADSFVSTRHAELFVADAGVEIVDLQSSNHTYVDDVQIGERTRLSVGARLRFGPKVTAVLR